MTLRWNDTCALVKCEDIYKYHKQKPSKYYCMLHEVKRFCDTLSFSLHWPRRRGTTVCRPMAV